MRRAVQTKSQQGCDSTLSVLHCDFPHVDTSIAVVINFWSDWLDLFSAKSMTFSGIIYCYLQRISLTKSYIMYNFNENGCITMWDRSFHAGTNNEVGQYPLRHHCASPLRGKIAPKRWHFWHSFINGRCKSAPSKGKGAGKWCHEVRTRETKAATFNVRQLSVLEFSSQSIFRLATYTHVQDSPWKQLASTGFDFSRQFTLFDFNFSYAKKSFHSNVPVGLGFYEIQMVTYK